MQGPRQGEDVLVQSVPTVHPEEYIPEIVAANDLKAVFIAPTHNQLDQMERRCSNQGLTTRNIRTNYDKCPSYKGNCGKTTKQGVRESIKRGATLGALHSTGDLPCCPSCPFAKQNRPAFTEQVILAHPVHAYMSDILKDRVVFTCALRGSAYITEIENPSQALDPYIKANTNFTGYSDLIKNSRNGLNIRSIIQSDLKPGTRDKEFGYDIESDGHHLAPQATFELKHRVELDNGWETSYHRRERAPGHRPPTNGRIGNTNLFEVVNIDYDRVRTVRKPGKRPSEDTIYVLDVPDFREAESVVAFDVSPIRLMWNTYYGINFDLERVYSDDKTVTFLQNEMDVEVYQTADSRKPYDGNKVTPGRDESIAIWTTAEFGKPICVTTKNAINAYPSGPISVQNWVNRFVKYREGSKIISTGSPVILVNGSPRPNDETLKKWGALIGRSVQRSKNSTTKFGSVGDKIRHQFSESRVAESATRFTDKDTTIILNTTAVPDWLGSNQLASEASPTDVIASNGTGHKQVAHYLYSNSGNSKTKREIQNNANVSGSTERNALNVFLNQGWVVRRSYPGRQPNEYTWKTQSQSSRNAGQVDPLNFTLNTN